MDVTTNQHDYRRVNDPNSVRKACILVDEDAIHDLITNRIKAIRDGRTDEAVAFMHKLLRDHGVYLNQRERTWKVLGPTVPRDPDDKTVLSSTDEQAVWEILAKNRCLIILDQKDEVKHNVVRLMTEYGVGINSTSGTWHAGYTNGHPFQYAMEKPLDSLNLNLTAIHSLISRNWQCHVLHNSEEAKACRTQLLVEHDVALDTDTFQWKLKENLHHWYKPVTEVDSDELDLGSVNALLSKLSCCQGFRNTRLLESVRAKLICDFGVVTNTKKRTWQVRDHRHFQDTNIARADNDKYVFSMEEDTKIKSRLVRITKCLQSGYAKEATDLQMELFHTFGVHYDRSLRVYWREPSISTPGATSFHPFVQQQASTIATQTSSSTDKIQAIDTMLSILWGHHLSWRNEESAQILEKLSTDYGVCVDFQEKSWQFRSGTGSSLVRDENDRESDDIGEDAKILLSSFSLCKDAQLLRVANMFQRRLLKNHGIIVEGDKWRFLKPEEYKVQADPKNKLIDSSSKHLPESGLAKKLMARCLACHANEYKKEERELVTSLMKDHGIFLDTKKNTWCLLMSAAHEFFYEADDDGATNPAMDEAELYAVNALLEQLSDKVRAEDWRTVRQLRKELFEDYSVTCDFHKKIWRVGLEKQHFYQRAEEDSSTVQDESSVNELLQQIMNWVQLGQIKEAKAVQGRLMSKHGVLVDLSKREWSAGYNQGHSYSRAPDDTSEVDVDAVSQLLKRHQALYFASEDQERNGIALQLMNSFGVRVDDQNSLWMGGYDKRHGFKRLATDSSHVDEEAVEGLLVERAGLLAQDRYGEAEKVLTKLLAAHCVRVDDDRWTWTVSSNLRRSETDSCSIDVDAVTKLLESRDKCLQAANREEAESIENRLFKEFGVRIRGIHWFVAHPYKRDKLDCSDVDMNRVHALLAKRQQWLNRGKFGEALMLKKELRNKYGVFVDDNRKIWQGGLQQQSHLFRQEAGDLTSLDPKAHNLIRQASHAIESNKKIQSKTLLSLIQDHGIVLNTTSRTWRGGYLHGHSFQGNTDGAVDIDEVNRLLKAREECLLTKGFEESNRLQRKLFDDHHVILNFNDRTWQLGFPRGSWYIRAPEDQIDVDIDSVHDLLDQLRYFVWTKMNDKANAISRQLLVIHGVATAGRRWYVVDTVEHDCVRSPDDNSDVDVTQVNSLIARIVVCLRRAFFEDSMALQGRLLLEHGVVMDTKEKSWRGGFVHGHFFQRHPQDVSTVDQDAVNKLLGEYMVLSQQKNNVEKAHKVLASLLLQHGVVVDIANRRWRGANANEHHFSRSENDETSVDTHKIDPLLAKWEHFVAHGMVDQANDVKAALLNVHGVVMDEKQLMWQGGSITSMNHAYERVVDP